MRAVLVMAAAAAVVSAVSTTEAWAQQAPVEALGPAWNAADAPAWGRLFWPEAEFTNIRGQVFHGVGENMAQHAHIWATIYKGSHFAARTLRVWPLGPDHALIDTEARVTGFAPLPGVAMAEPGVLLTRFRHIVERRHGEWRILFSQNTVVMPPPGLPTLGK